MALQEPDDPAENRKALVSNFSKTPWNRHIEDHSKKESHYLSHPSHKMAWLSAKRSLQPRTYPIGQSWYAVSTWPPQLCRRCLRGSLLLLPAQKTEGINMSKYYGISNSWRLTATGHRTQQRATVNIILHSPPGDHSLTMVYA